MMIHDTLFCGLVAFSLSLFALDTLYICIATVVYAMSNRSFVWLLRGVWMMVQSAIHVGPLNCGLLT